jgi:saccharopine dehydrogenase (NAD+, L-lysine-forming)
MQPHLWVRAEQRDSEQRVGITPDGVARLMAAGFRVSVERSSCRAIPIEGFAGTDCAIVDENSWPDAPADAIIFGLKELPDDGTPLPHRHIMFGHAYKGQTEGPALLSRFREGGGTLYDLEYLTHENGRRVAAFGYWAGFAGAAVGLKVWAAQQAGNLKGPARIHTYPDKDALLQDLRTDLSAARANQATQPDAIIVGALGRVGHGAGDLLEAMGLQVTRWDMAETKNGGPFPEILAHSIFVNCVLAGEHIPVFVPKSALTAPRRLSVIADVSCDPTSPYNPVPIYDHATTFDDPVIRSSSANPPLDVTAIDNLPSMLPVEASEDYSAQLLPSLLTLDQIDGGVWGRARAIFDRHAGDHT